MMTTTHRSYTLLGVRLVLPLLVVVVCLLLQVSMTNGRAILGVDLGSLYMKVALVQSGSPLEIVTNLHSKRKTEQMVLFDKGMQRFYGADASALLARKSHLTPSAMSVMLGRDEEHPVVQVLAERHYPLVPLYNESRSGVQISVDGTHFTPEELVAMVLTHAVDISVAYAAEHGNTIAPPRDIVLTVPSFATQHERRALLDAAELADLNVLTLLDENTAAAVHYAMDKTFADSEQLLLFYNMGASSTQVSLIRFYSYANTATGKTVPALEILAKAWDATLGGQAFDHLIVEYLADEFNQAYQKAKPASKGFDVRTQGRAMTKLRLQANKVKHVLSANTEIPVYMDAVHDEVSLSTTITRDQLETLATPLLQRTVQPILTVLQRANVTVDQLTEIELIGGGMRIPRIQTAIQKAMGSKTLGLHMNADESMALGAAFTGANISTAFRVRPVGMTDLNPFTMSVALSNLPAANSGKVDKKKKQKDGDDDEANWSKQATIFKAWGKMGVKKTIAFTHDQNVHCELDYVTDDADGPLPASDSTPTAIERYNITGIAEFAAEVAEKNLGKPKVSLQFELSSSGITSLVKAEAAVEETYMVEEEVEVEDDEALAVNESLEDSANTTDESSSEERKLEEDTVNTTTKKDVNATSNVNATDATNSSSSKPAKKLKKKIKVEKEKKRTLKRTLSIQTYHVGRVRPHSPDLLAESKQKLLNLALKDKERMMLEESKNKVESFIYRIKNKLEDDADAIGAVTTQEQRDEVRKLAEDAEEWLYEDGYSADYPTMEDKFAEIAVPFEAIMLRVSETKDRPEAIETLKKKLNDVEQLLAKWEESKPQITEEERTKAAEMLEEARKWISDNEEAQAKLQPHEKPAFFSADVPLQSKTLEAYVVRLSKKPKPKPPKNETAANATDANITETNATESTSNDTASELNNTAEESVNVGEAEDIIEDEL